MKILNNNFKIFILTLASLLLGVFLWNKISLPYSNPENVYGILSVNKFNPLNNDLRFIILISLVFGTFFLSLIFYKKNMNTFNEIIFFEKKKKTIENYKYLNVVFLVFLTFVTFEFLSMSYPLNEIDFFHEGERLTPAKNYVLNGKMWSGVFFNHGAFTDLFGTVIGWKIFGNETIGSHRLIILIFIFFTKLILLILTFKIAKLIKSDETTKIIYFSLIAISVLQLTEYTAGATRPYLTYKDLPCLIFLIFSMEILLKQNKNHYAFLIGLISSISVFFQLDRGIYTNVLILFLFVFFLLRKEFKIAALIFLGLILSWSILYFFIGSEEFSFFINDTYHYLTIRGFLNGYIYPTPFISEKFYTTKGILIIIISGLLIIYSLLVKNEKKDNSLIFYFFIIFLLGLLAYKNALNRSDPSHIRYSISYPIFLICLIFFKEISFNINKKLNSYNLGLKFVASLSIILFLSVLIINNSYLKGKHSPKTVNNLINLKNRVKEYVELSDKNFVQNRLLPVIDYYKKISEEDNCVQPFTNETVWSYLTHKQMCTRFSIIWFAASDKFQKDFINQLSSSNARYVLMDAPYSIGGAGKLWADGIPYEKRHPLIYQYFSENFKFHKNINGWIFFERKKL